jgi:hypothetical protein
MQSNAVPRSTWIILGAILLVLAVLTGVFVANSIRREGSGLQGVQEIEGRRYEVDRSAPTKPVRACDLLQEADVETILGRPVGDAVQTTADNPLGETVCIIPDPENPDHTLVQLSIVYNQGMQPFLQENGYTVEQLYDGRNIGGGQTESIRDVGDKAFWGGSGVEMWNGLHVLVWDVYLDIDVSSGSARDDLQRAEAIAGAVLAELYPPQ